MGLIDPVMKMVSVVVANRPILRESAVFSSTLGVGRMRLIELRGTLPDERITFSTQPTGEPSIVVVVMQYKCLYAIGNSTEFAATIVGCNYFFSGR